MSFLSVGLLLFLLILLVISWSAFVVLKKAPLWSPSLSRLRHELICQLDPFLYYKDEIDLSKIDLSKKVQEMSCLLSSNGMSEESLRLEVMYAELVSKLEKRTSVVGRKEAIQSFASDLIRLENEFTE